MDLFSDRLKELRHNKSVTQKEVSNAIGISDRAYFDFERGKSKPAFETLVALCNYFSCSSDYLLGFSKTKERHYEY